jgi:hypothetical protein
MLDLFDRLPSLGDCKFVCVPDVLRCVNCRATVDSYGGEPCSCGVKPRFVYGDADLTLRRFEEWHGLLADIGVPVAYVLQDGSESVGVPFDAIDALFIGGSTDFKLGAAAAGFARQAKARGKWVHWGRINTRKRFEHIVATGACDSFDGSKWSRWRKTYLDEGLGWCLGLGQQRLEVAA